MARSKLAHSNFYYTMFDIMDMLGLSRYQITHRIEKGIFSKPTYIDPDTGTRYFGTGWLIEAKEAMHMKQKKTTSSD